MTWQDLAAKTIRRANGVQLPYFSPMEIRAAMQVAAVAVKIAQEQQEKEYAELNSLSQN